MSQNKAQAQTLQERFGFKDDELKTPKHDEMMLWLDVNVEHIIQNLCPKTWSPEDVASILACVEEAVENSRQHTPETWNLGNPPPMENVIIEKKVWEYPVVKGDRGLAVSKYNNTYIVGFVDMAVEYLRPRLEVSGLKYYYGKWKFSLSDKDELPKWNIYHVRKMICFEVKPSIQSLGELIRQLRMYETYLPEDCKLAVVCPDDRFAPFLREQGFLFVKYS